ncbi:hypothetical protein [Sphingomonas sp. KC8]|uniref:hypothetical protein n=1 Tax=Sphingomonas sp. KC8 TaxID=1030157 RepID=UPI000248A012|nr:hypothetical protein [Sphingomonas sp. KC8]ARS29150.1 hypothetical protein KC8_17915 [Sphingomonas sp. KC8]
MTPDERDRLARTRYTILSAMRASGVLLMILGLWIWNGDILQAGGLPIAGIPLFALGFAEALLLPQILARKWRTPPES